jgi:hypothetical protein
MFEYKKYYFVDTTIDPEDEGYEVILLATSVQEAWDVLEFDNERYMYVAGPAGEDDEWIWLVD